jgi:hypothetical protein
MMGIHLEVVGELLDNVYSVGNRWPKEFFLTECIVYFLNTVHCDKIFERIMKYKYIGVV